MNRKTFLKAAVASSLAFPLLVGARRPPGLSNRREGMTPNILLISTDDQPAWTTRWQPKLRRIMGDQGTTFEGACAADPLCGPNRASTLLGRYSHNHRIRDNTRATELFRGAGHEADHYGHALKAAGYRTGWFGKWLNEHPHDFVPSGWDRGYFLVGHQGDPDEFWINDDGTVRNIPRNRWDDTDLLATRAADFAEYQRSVQPWFCALSLWAPHFPFGGLHIPARHRHDYDGMAPPSGPEFRDPPEHYDPMKFTDAWLRNYHEGAREELQAVDDAVEKMVGRLGTTGQLADTLVLYTTDNGFISGQHRQIKKSKHYDESVRVPLIVRGPGVARGGRTDALVSSADIAPTLAETAGADFPCDGRSLVPLFGGAEPEWWRTNMLVGHASAGNEWDMLRTKRHSYVEFSDDDRLLYDRLADPKMLRDADDEADPVLLEEMRVRLAAMRDCSGDACRAAEDAP